ncbi:glycolate oxidase subunit GlcE [Phenylobacterium sp.]|uniref:glycolate oxidase subunit GlcE n=1 Tax=Phenylobacterium sp. TaxID=1871053 RepID=UPI002DF2B57E|nr:glycolate oxidase subunit GlcE [Phenylobacterium sp.]
MLDEATRLLTPATPDEVLEILAEAAAAQRRIEVVGGGTKRSVGKVERPELTLSLAGLDAVLDYAPEELVLTARPGAKLKDLEKLVASEGQMLPFEPPRLAKLLGAKGEPTLGGALAANLSGPRRIRAGAARDHLLGFAAVSGRAESFKAGGKVVKNVTGYDLSKLMAGSWGTLAVMTEVTIKVLPKPKTEASLLLFGLDDRRATQAMAQALNAPVEVSGAAHLPPAIAARAPLKAEMAVTALRLEGFDKSVAARVETLREALKAFGRVERLDAALSRGFWAQVREVEVFQKDARPLWRVSTPPASGWRIGEALKGQEGGHEVLYDWAGGLVWAQSDDAQAVRAAARAAGGHAALWRGEAALAAFEPLEGALSALTARVKAAFDPHGILNPGRLG